MELERRPGEGGGRFGELSAEGFERNRIERGKVLEGGKQFRLLRQRNRDASRLRIAGH